MMQQQQPQQASDPFAGLGGQSQNWQQQQQQQGQQKSNSGYEQITLLIDNLTDCVSGAAGASKRAIANTLD